MVSGGNERLPRPVYALAGVPFGAGVIGALLLAATIPAVASDTPDPEVALVPDDDSTRRGDAVTVALSVTPPEDEAVCARGELSGPRGFTPVPFEERIAAGATETVELAGTPRETGTLGFAATLRFAGLEEGECGEFGSAREVSLEISVGSSPPASGTPSESPSPSESPDPTPTETPSETPDPTPSESDRPSQPSSGDGDDEGDENAPEDGASGGGERPANPGQDTDGDPGQDHGAAGRTGSGGGTGDRTPDGAPEERDRPPSDPAGGLPTDPADIPVLEPDTPSPGAGGPASTPATGSDLAELPFVSPGESEASTAEPAASEPTERRGAMTPGVLLLFGLLLLLLCAPLAPARRIRAGWSPYRGRRRGS